MIYQRLNLFALYTILSIFWTGLSLVCLAFEVLASSVARWHLAWCQRFLGHSYSFMPGCLCCSEDPLKTTLLVRELADGGKLLPTCSRA